MPMTVQGMREATIQPTEPNAAGVSEACVLIAAGVNKTGRRKYTPEFLSENVARFEGAFCHADHPSISEARDRPERSVRDMAAVVRNVRWDPDAGTVLGDLEYLTTQAGVDMREAFRNPVVRERAGLSIYWPGGVKVKREKLQEGTVDVPLALVGDGQFDVDFVTRPAAGGKVAPLREGEEGAVDMDVSELTVEVLEAERPDLVAAIREAVTPAPEPVADPEPEPEPVAEAEEIVVLRREVRQLRAAEVLRERLAEAGLPEKGAAFVRSRFAEAECEDREAFGSLVEVEIANVKALAEDLSEAGRVRGIGSDTTPPEKVDVLGDLRRVCALPAE